jgi:hypothetical protein
VVDFDPESIDEHASYIVYEVFVYSKNFTTSRYNPDLGNHYVLGKIHEYIFDLKMPLIGRLFYANQTKIWLPTW